MRRHVERLGLSTGHFTHDRRVRGLRPFWRPQTPEVQVFCRDSSASPTVLRRKARQRLGPIVCAGCANPGWHNGAPLTLQLDHINGVHNDNRVENLRWLCPNCHSQTASYAGRGSKRRWTVREPRAAYVVRRAAFSGLPAGAYSPSAT